MVGRTISAVLLHFLISAAVAFVVAALIGGDGDLPIIVALLVAIMLQISFLTTIVLMRKPERRR